jgi:hypothetical protein
MQWFIAGCQKYPPGHEGVGVPTGVGIGVGVWVGVGVGWSVGAGVVVAGGVGGSEPGRTQNSVSGSKTRPGGHSSDMQWFIAGCQKYPSGQSCGGTGVGVGVGGTTQYSRSQSKTIPSRQVVDSHRFVPAFQK